MDADCISWCEENNLSETTIQELVKEEFTSSEAMKAITIEVIEQFKISKGQFCLLCKAVLHLQRESTNARGAVTDTAAPQEVAPQNGGPLLATGINCELADVEAALTKTEVNGRRECSSNQSGGLLHARPHEILYIRSRRGSSEKIRPLDISYHDRMVQDEAGWCKTCDFCTYLKFVAKKATSFRSSSVLAFDDEFRTELASGSSSLRSFGDMECLSDIAASHFDYLDSTLYHWDSKAHAKRKKISTKNKKK